MKKKLLIAGFLILSGTCIYAQNSKDEGETDPGFTDSKIPKLRSVQQMPEYPGGKFGLMRYLRENIQYPPMAARLNLEGQVIAQFVVSPTGAIGSITIKRGLSYECDQEVIRVIKNMPHWKPGMQDGKPVYVYYLLPVTFRLNNQPQVSEKMK